MTVPQQAFLRDAMRRLNMTREVFANRIGVSRRALDTWLLPDDSQESRGMPEIVERFVSEIVCRPTPDENHTQSVEKQGLASQFLFEGKPQLLSVDQFSRDSVEALFRVADVMQPIARRRKISRVLEGAVLGNLFFEASTRTRVSFGAAFARLGGSVCDTTGFTFSSMAKGESIYDTSRVMSGYVDALVIRHPEKGSVAEFARATNLPVINGGDGPGEHPSQALLDLYTIQREFSRVGKIVDGAHIALVGDLKYGRTVHSLLHFLERFHNVQVYLIAPDALKLPDYMINFLKEHNMPYCEVSSIDEVLPELDVLYMTRIQRERFTSAQEYENLEGSYQLTAEKMKRAKKDMLVLHPLPRVDEIAQDVDDDPRAVYFRQARFGMFGRMALLLTLSKLPYERAGHQDIGHEPGVR